MAIHPRNISGIAPEAVELLEAVGHDNVLNYVRLNPAGLHQELKEANASLKLSPADVSLEEVARWLHEAVLMASKLQEQEEVAPVVEEAAAPSPDPEPQVEEEKPMDPSMAVDYEQSTEVQDMLEGSPFALPLPVQALKEERVPVSDIPLGLLLNHYVGDLEVRVNQSTPKSRNASQLGMASLVGEGRSAPPLDATKVRNTEPGTGGGTIFAEEPSLIHTPLESTNKGKNPNSRWYIRGVLHPSPFSLKIAAMATFLVVWLVPASVISAVLLILSREMPEQYAWVSPQLLWVPGALLFFGLLYLFFGIGGRCRICNQKLFIYRAHIKNSQAHRIPGLGHVIPLCLHLLIFRWFRCTHCGTPIRLKK